MRLNTSKYTDEELLGFIIRDLKTLGKIIPTANFNRGIILTFDEIKKISKETKISESEIYMKYG
jgi:hypothetical protein